MSSGFNGGELWIQRDDGNDAIKISNGNNGAYLIMKNKTGEEVVQLRTDENGNGFVGVYNRKGKGRTLQPGIESEIE